MNLCLNFTLRINKIGKTSLAKRLVERFPNSVHIIQDNFFHKKESGKLEFLPEVNSFNYDCLAAIDAQQFSEYFNQVCSTPDLDFVFVDGFLLFYFDIKFDKKYFFTLTKEECKERRSKRKYKTVDNPNYFEKLVWPNYLAYIEYCQNKFPDIEYLEGAMSLDQNFEIVKNELLQLLEN